MSTIIWTLLPLNVNVLNINNNNKCININFTLLCPCVNKAVNAAISYANASPGGPGGPGKPGAPDIPSTPRSPVRP